MPMYNGGEFILSRRETELFQKQLQNPNRDLLSRRDAFLDEIERTLCIRETVDGVSIDVIDEPICFSITSADTYFPMQTKTLFREILGEMQVTQRVHSTISETITQKNDKYHRQEANFSEHTEEQLPAA